MTQIDKYVSVSGENIEIIGNPEQNGTNTLIAGQTIMPVENQDLVVDENIEFVDKSEQNDTNTAPIEQTSDIPTEQQAEIVSPSAPMLDEEELENEAQPKTMNAYPDLQQLQQMATKSDATIDRIVLQPFSNAQLKELYHNPEMHLADTFEVDFINNELSNPHKSHPLHELIKKYSQSRYNLKVNMLDLQGFIRAFQENSQKLWIMENRITSYEGNCADGERVRKNELYE